MDKSSQIRGILQQVKEFPVVGQIRELCKSHDDCKNTALVIVFLQVNYLVMSQATR